MRKTLATLMALGSLALGSTGCTMTPEGNAFLRQTFIGAAQSGANSYASERARVAANPANAVPPQTNINVYNPPQQRTVEYPPRPEPKPVPYGMNSMTGYSDKDGDGQLSQVDVDNLNKMKFDLAKDKSPQFLLNLEDYDGKVKWEITHPDGQKEELTSQAVKNHMSLLPIDGKNVYKSGEYTVSATTDDGKTHSMKVEIITKKRWNENTPIGLFTYSEWKDEDGDGYLERSELKGLGKKIFDLDKEDMAVAFNLPNQKGKIRFRTLTLDGKLIGETIEENPGIDVVRKFTGPDCPTQGDFMDCLKGAGSGKYRITASVDGVENEFSLEIEVQNTGKKEPEKKTEKKQETIQDILGR